MYTNCVTKFSYATKAGQTPVNPLKINQDVWIACPNFCVKKYMHMFAVADGHGQNGHLVTNLVK